jgi:hypothetical protein
VVALFVVGVAVVVVVGVGGVGVGGVGVVVVVGITIQTIGGMMLNGWRDMIMVEGLASNLRKDK